MNKIEDLVKEIAPAKEERPKTYTAEVSHTDDEGVVWVRLPGADQDTPTASTSAEVKMGDVVNVEWRNNRLYIAGNYSNPSAGVARVVNVEQAATIANQAATQAVADAERAGTAANEAQASATQAAVSAGEAKTQAQQAKAQAVEAKTQAEHASEYAARALGNLSTVQSVAETLSWITQHGTMTLTTDTDLDPTHVYFVQDSAGDYVVGGTHYAVVTEPDADDLSSYYVLSIDESLNNYVATHLAVDSEGLWIIPDANGNRVLIATGQGTGYPSAGTYIIDDGGDIVASFLASGATIGDSDEAHITVSPSALRIYGENNVLVGNIKSVASGQGTHTEHSQTFSLGHTSVSYVMRLRPKPSFELRDITVRITVTNETAGYTDVKSLNFSDYGSQNTTVNGIGVTVKVIDGNSARDEVEAKFSAYPPSVTDTYKAQFDVIYRVYNVFPSVAFGPDHDAIRGKYAFIAGLANKAGYENQTVIGKYNNNKSANAFEIGNGSDANNRSNALEVDWNGNVTASGDITDGNGNVLADKADTSEIPTKVSDLTNDSGYITTETDPTVPSWAKASTKPAYTASEVGALPTAGGTVTGNLKINGGLTLGGHSSPIGAILTARLASATSVNTSTATAICSITLPAGTWVVVGYAQFHPNSTGVRTMNLHVTSGSNFRQVAVPAANGYTAIETTIVVKIAESTTYYLNVWHNAGTSLTMAAGTDGGYTNGIRAVRIA